MARFEEIGGLRYPRPGGAAWTVHATAGESSRARTPLGGMLGPGDRDYRYTGFFIGAGLGVAATVFAAAWCGDSDNNCSSGRAWLVGPILAAGLGVGGAVVGGFFPKTPPPPPEPGF